MFLVEETHNLWIHSFEMTLLQEGIVGWSLLRWMVYWFWSMNLNFLHFTDNSAFYGPESRGQEAVYLKTWGCSSWWIYLHVSFLQGDCETKLLEQSLTLCWNNSNSALWLLSTAAELSLPQWHWFGSALLWCYWQMYPWGRAIEIATV